MAKKVIGLIKLQISAGKANPSPPIGPALGQHGVNIMDFCKAFNAKTQKDGDTVIPVVITVYADRSFSFILLSHLCYPSTVMPILLAVPAIVFIAASRLPAVRSGVLSLAISSTCLLVTLPTLSINPINRSQ